MDQSSIAFDYDEHKNALSKLRDCFVENSVKIAIPDIYETLKSICDCERAIDMELETLPSHEGLLNSIEKQKEELANTEKVLSAAKQEKRDAQFNLKKIRLAYMERLNNDAVDKFIAKNDKEQPQKLIESMLTEIYQKLENLQELKTAYIN